MTKGLLKSPLYKRDREMTCNKNNLALIKNKIKG